MALTKEEEYDRIDIRGEYKLVHLRRATIVKEDGVELSRSHHRHFLAPSSFEGDVDSDGEFDGTFTHTDTDISGEPADIQAICVAVWTDAVKAAWKTHQEETYHG